MSSDPQIWVPVSQINLGALAAGNWTRGIPLLGASELGIPAPVGIADCRDLLRSSPPTLLEDYEITNFSIGMACGVQDSGGGFASAPEITLELALLVNDRVRYVADSGPLQTPAGPGAPGSYLASYSFSADIVNPIVIGARERLTLRAGVNCNLAVNENSWVWVGIQASFAAGVFTPSEFESTISYNVRQLSPIRQL